jgi:hypothetical protein
LGHPIFEADDHRQLHYQGFVDRVPPSLRIKLLVAIYDSLVRRSDQAKKQRHRKKQAESIKPSPDIRPNPVADAKE